MFYGGVIGESIGKDPKLNNGGSLVATASFLMGPSSPDHHHHNQNHMIVDPPIFGSEFIGGEPMSDWNPLVVDHNGQHPN